MVDRYVAGSHALHESGFSEADRRIARFAIGHPATLPFLDAAAAVTRSAPLLRAKLQLMAAIVEASPRFAGEFFPAPSTRATALLRLAWYGAATVLKALIGFPLLLGLGAVAS